MAAESADMFGMMEQITGKDRGQATGREGTWRPSRHGEAVAMADQYCSEQKSTSSQRAAIQIPATARDPEKARAWLL